MVQTVYPPTGQIIEDGAAHVLMQRSGALILNRFLDTNGDGSGVISHVGDYSAAQGIAYIQPPADEVYWLSRMIVSIEDTTGFSASKYGNINGGLADGLQLRVEDDSGTVLDLTPGHPIAKNVDWAFYCYDADLKTWGVGNEFLVVLWTFAKSGAAIRLDGAKNARLEMLLNDDLTGLVDQHFVVQGFSANHKF